MNLWIDDIRDPNSSFWRDKYNIPSDVVWAKTYDEAFDLIMRHDILWVGFDNDLGDPRNRQGKHLYSLLEERTALGLNPLFEAVFQTSNTVARQEMISGYLRLIEWMEEYG